MPRNKVSLRPEEEERLRNFVEQLYVSCRNADSPHRTVASISRDTGDLILKVLNARLEYDDVTR